MKITFGTPDEAIQSATIEELLRAIISPDGCGSKKKLLILQALMTYEPHMVKQHVETYITRGETP